VPGFIRLFTTSFPSRLVSSMPRPPNSPWFSMSISRDAFRAAGARVRIERAEAPLMNALLDLVAVVVGREMVFEDRRDARQLVLHSLKVSNGRSRRIVE
jgi:hypothetical protein